ncbi:hypothetical protein Mal4_16900 [Maioricimonas rarisocia]|uniref:Uncharacterized protein n=1 Tax=Maioricimonas rarisocia TaxID=2528026 RepID=A0A517Z4I5_9PLAN|nr:hypothetical protein [Maioricimonas rarisocia]QDU37379.1 hypothetical protein Mal4_16900 [Maioricimonas rarisocia]
MTVRKFLLPLVFSFSLMMVGCGGDGVPEDAPPTPEPGSAEYDAYDSSSDAAPGPGGGHAGPGSGHGS